MIEFRVLGPLEVLRHGQPIDIGAGKRRALLAVLLLHRNEVVSTDRLIDEVWGESAPVTAAKVVQGYVSQLRRALAGAGGGPQPIQTTHPGYVLRVEADQLDSSRFAVLLSKGRATLSAGAARDASRLLREALELWRGPPLAEFTFEPFAREEIGRLEELRFTAVEERIEADLALGLHAELVAELEALVAREPSRERLRGQLMLALYRCGRQADALEVYQETRRELVGGLGLEPSRALQELEQAVLRQDRALDVVAERRSEAARVKAPARRAGLFVGRERELEVLQQALDDSLGGRGRLVLIGGEPGIGKSRLAEELAERARAAGAEVLWGRCWEAGGAPPYWPWAQALRVYVRDRDVEQLRRELGPGASELADLIPDIRHRLPELGAASEQADPQQVRFELFDAVSNFLRRASRTKPLVLVFDDLHWADKESLLLFEFAARELVDAPLLVVGTYRHTEVSHSLAHALGELARERLFERVLLSGLANDDVARFLEDACGFAPDPDLVSMLRDNTEGNPFFVSEVVQLLLNEGGLDVARIPDGVREAIGARLARLSPPCNEMLTLASALGREFTLAQLAQIAEVSDDELLNELEEALTAHILEEPPGSAGRYQFTHTLIQGTLLDSLSQTRRARLHARIAQALEALYGEQVDSHAAELVHHFHEARAVLGTGKLVRYSLPAGESALAAHAPEQALAYFERALAAEGDRELNDETAALVFGIARAQLATLPPHEVDVAITSLRRVYEHYVAAGEVDRAVGVAAHPLPLSLGFGHTDAADLIADALALVASDSHDSGRLLAQHGWFVGFIEGDYDRAQLLFGEASRIAAREQDAALERRTLANAAFVDAFHLRWADCLARALPAVELAVADGDPRAEMAARRSVAFASSATGMREQAHANAAAALAQARRLRESWWLTSSSFSNELACLYDGDWETARELSELGLSVAANDPRHLGLRAILDCQLGNFSESAAHIARLHEVAASVSPPGPIADHVFSSVAAALVACAGGTDEQLDAGAAFARGVLALPRLAPALRLYATNGLALTAVHRRDAEAAEELYARIEPHRGTASFFVPLANDRVLGLLAATCGRRDSALEHFAAGMEFCRGAGYRAEYAWTIADCVEVLLDRGLGDDRGRAAALRDEGLQIAGDLGMRALADRVGTGRRPAGLSVHDDH
jgi:DNA-binding SARP family transcriptional activator